METQKATGYPSIDKPWLKYYSPKALSLSIPNMSIYDYVYESNKDRMDKPMLNYFGNRITGQDFFGKVKRLAGAFALRGVKRGDIVTLISLITPETIYCIYALNYLGAVVNSVYLSMSENEIANSIYCTDSKMVVALELVTEKVVKAIERMPTKVPVVVISISDSLPLGKKLLYRFKKRQLQKCKGLIRYNDFIKRTCPTKHEAQPDDTALIVYTSGTTGTPKGVILSNANINSTAFQYLHSGMSFERGETYFSFLPLFLSIGFCLGTHMPLSLGLELIICPDPSPSAVTALFKKMRPNHFTGAPANNLDIAKHLKGDLSYIKTFAAGGGSVTSEQEKSINAFLRQHNSTSKLITGYGMTEFSATVTTSRNDAYRSNTIGIPLPYANVKIVDKESGKELGYNETGEMLFTSPGQTCGYYHDSKATEELIETDCNGIRWIHTGDLGEIDKDGFLFFKGKLKRIYLKTGEDGTPYKIFPQRLEELLSDNPTIKSCAVIVKENEELQHIQIACIVPNSSKDKTAYLKSISSYCNEHLPNHMVPDGYIIMETLPYLSNGKVDYRTLEEIPSQNIVFRTKSKGE